MSNEERVLQAFIDAGKPVGTKAIVEATGMDKKDVEKAMKALKAEGKIHSPKRCVYEPA